MDKNKKKLNTAVNTEIDQALAAINFAESTAIERPPQGKLKKKILGLAVLLVLFLGGLYYYAPPGSNLANYLPADTKFYAAVSLPPKKKWFSPLLFWESGHNPNAAVSRLYAKMDLLSWAGASWQENILPLFSGRLEIAILPGAGGAGSLDSLVMRSGLKDKAAWFKLFGLPADYEGQTLTRDILVSGAWGALTKNPNKIAWRIVGNDLYLTDKADILPQLSVPRSATLAKQLKSLKAKAGLALIYAKDKDFLEIDNPYIKALASQALYPLVISLKQAVGAVNFVVHGQPERQGAVKSTALAAKLYDFDSAFYGQNLALAYAQAEAGLPDNFKNNFWPILKDFYGVEPDAALTAIGQSEIFLAFSGSDWLLNIDNHSKENNKLLAMLKKAGAALFALTHPKAVERLLGDGTKLLELRAETADLDWREEPWSYASQAVNMESLRGQGEPSGYYVGFVPEIGYILTTSMPLLNQYAVSNQADRSTDIEASGCAAPKNTLLAASLPINSLTTDVLWQSIAQKIIITVPAEEKITGCVLLKD